MASPQIYNNGAGGSTGHDLATAGHLTTSGWVWYVYSVTGSDAASPRGRERIRPLATIAQAITNAAASDTICILSGHTETLTGSQAIATAGLNIVGEGSGSNRPKFTSNGDINMFDITAAGVMLGNLYFPACGTTTTKGKVRTAAAGTVIDGCHFQCGANDDGPAFETITGAGEVTVRDTTFISSSSDVTTQPDSCIKVTNAITALYLKDVIMDGGSSGWANPYAFNGAGAITRLKAEGVSLLGDSDMTLATGSTGYITVTGATGSARIVWAA